MQNLLDEKVPESFSEFKNNNISSQKCLGKNVKSISTLA